MIYEIRAHFDAAHKLLLPYESKCKNLHGHRWEILVRVQIKEIAIYGICVDFKELKQAINDCLPDHQCLNDLWPDENPTAENLVRIIFKALHDHLDLKFEDMLALDSVQLFESPECSVLYSGE